MNKDFTIFVNSSDGFEDCWIPFFKLFKKYLPDCNANILLNTEFKEFEFDGLNIKSSKVNLGIERKLSWSECLLKALKQVETPYVLYLQEDYFIEKRINNEEIINLVSTIKKTKTIKYLGLTHRGNYPPFDKYFPDNRFKVVSKKSKYRISTQAAIWDVETLISYIVPDENGWMFEIFGTQRAKNRNDLFLTINIDFYPDSLVFYQLTGIVKGKWIKTMPALFNREQICIDFNARGFYIDRSGIFRKFETFNRLSRDPFLFLKKLFIYKILRSSF